MRIHIRRAAILALAAGFSRIALAQQVPAAQPSPEDRLRALEQRLNSLEQHYQSELQTRDAQIADLRAQLQSSRATATQPATQSDLDRADAMHQMTQNILNDIET